MTFPPSTTQCPPPPPSSPSHQNQAHQQQQQQQQHEPLPQQQIVNLLQFAESSYTTNPTDALSALLDALTLTTGTNTTAQHAMNRIRSELGDVVADCVAGNVANATSSQQQHHAHYSSATSLSEREMTLRAMEIVNQMITDESTILYGQGRQHLLQEAMEDGSSVVCSKCGDMISRDRLEQHSQYWCRELPGEVKESGDDEDGMRMDD